MKTASLPRNFGTSSTKKPSSNGQMPNLSIFIPASSGEVLPLQGEIEARKQHKKPSFTLAKMDFSEKYQRIYIVGMPASGKSTFAQQLAMILEFDFLDLDEVIVAREGCSISDVFSQKGEAYFRQVEQEVLQQSLNNRTVIATGGGAPCFFENMDFIYTHGFSVFLDVPVEELARRSATQHGLRPLLNNLAGKALVEELQVKRDNRLPYYQRADLVLQGESIDPELVAGLFCDLREFFC